MDSKDAQPPRLAGDGAALDLSALTHFWEVQRKYNEHFVNLESLTSAKREELTRDYVLYSVEELMELQRHLHWKFHRRSQSRPTRDNILEESIDNFKYLVSICLAWGISPRDFFEGFLRKSLALEQLWRQEFERPFDPKKHNGVVAVDLDGVLANYVEGYLSWVESQTKTTLRRPRAGEDLYAIVSETFGGERAAELKHLFRETGGKMKLPVFEEALPLLRGLQDRKLYIVLLSARPYQQYRRIMADTMLWLSERLLPYDAIAWDGNKADRIIRDYPNLLCLIEDEPGHAGPVAGKGIAVLMPDRPYNLGFYPKMVFRYRTAEEALNAIDDLMM